MKNDLDKNKQSTKRGLVCNQCGCQHFYTIYTRPRGTGIARLKECRYCGRRIHTNEQIAK